MHEVVFGVLGYLMNKFGFSPVALILGLMLGPIAETSLLQALLISRGSLIFLKTPICILTLVLSAASVILSILFKEKGLVKGDREVS